ncbi:MAG TPA: TonB-dependent receptor [Thermoanaerobaculia bacterium]|nr:TonB-dependent receptor [Thermoanaerobaculia bacterium]
MRKFWDSSGAADSGRGEVYIDAMLSVLLWIALAQELPKQGETIVVVATHDRGSVLDAPQSVSVIDQKQIAMSAAGNIADLARGEPGINIVHTSARDVGIRSRGASGVAEHRELTLLDGRSTYLDFYGVVLWDFLPVNIDEIKQIEILRGPGSALWGPNALSGVINVRTKSPRELKGGSATLAAGQVGTRSASVLWAEVFDRYSYKASGSFFEQHAWQRDDTLPNYGFENKGTRQPKADLRFDWGSGSEPLWSYKIGYGGTTGIFHSRLGPFLIEPGTYVGYAEVDRNTNSFDAKAYWNRLRGDAPNLINGLNFSFAMDTYAAEATSRHAIGTKQLIVYGGSVRDSRFDLSIAPQGHERNEIGVFAEDSAILTNNLTAYVGARIDRFNTLGTAFSPRTSLVYKPRPDQAIHIAYNRAYRSPSLVDNFLDTSIPNSVGKIVFVTHAVGNPDLRAELVDAFEIGYNVSTARHGFFTASAYRNLTRNNIVFVPTEFYPTTLPKTFSFLNVGRVVDQGLEVSWDNDWSTAFSTKASLTYEENPKITNKSTIPLQVNRPPRYQGSLLANIRQARWFASGDVSYCDKAFWADVLDSRFWGTTRSYIMVDAAVGVPVGHNVDVLAKGTNLLDRRIKEHIFGDIIRRELTAEVRYRF